MAVNPQPSAARAHREIVESAPQVNEAAGRRPIVAVGRPESVAVGRLESVASEADAPVPTVPAGSQTNAADGPPENEAVSRASARVGPALSAVGSPRGSAAVSPLIADRVRPSNDSGRVIAKVLGPRANRGRHPM
ncbi:hypothetical protein ACVWY6_004558 [Williamsia sp. R60]